MAGEPEVAISSPATTGKDDAAVAGTALPFNISGSEPMTLPNGSAAIRTAADMMTMSGHRYFMVTSHKYLTP
jgi:hypothetical protein